MVDVKFGGLASAPTAKTSREVLSPFCTYAIQLHRLSEAVSTGAERGHMTREKFANQCCSSFIPTCVALLFLDGGPVCGQSQTIAKEYIRLGGKVIAIESYGQSQSSTVKIDVWPGTANLAPNQAVRLNSIVDGNTNTNVNWTISPNVGSILATGVYTAPPNPQPGQTVRVTATSAADPTKSATAVIRFYSPAINGAFPLMGSFLNFYRNLGQSQWGLEFDRMREIDMNTVVIVSVGGLRPVTGNAAAYTLSGVGLLYPSELIPISERPVTDRLEMMLSLADQRGMKVYLGSLQTHQDWSRGLKFSAIRS